MTSTTRRVGNFAAIGVVNTLIDLLAFVALRAAGLPVLGANAISTTAGLAFSFVANRRFTFGDRTGRPARQFLLFLGGTGFGLWVLQPAMILGVGQVMSSRGDPGEPALLWIPKLAGIACGAVWNYLFYDRVAFRVTTVRPGAEPVPEPAEPAAEPAPEPAPVPEPDRRRPGLGIPGVGWIPAGVATLGCGALLVAHDTPVRAVAAALAYYVLLVALPGTLLWRLFPVRPRSLLEQVAVGSGLALAVQVLLRWLLSAAGLQWLTPLWAVATVVVVSTVPRLRRVWRYEGPTGGRALPWAVAGAAGVAGWVIANDAFRTNPIAPIPGWSGQFYPTAPYVDMPFQQSLVWAVDRPWPLTYPYVPDTPLRYHIMVYEHLADLHQWTGADLTLVVFRLHTLPLTVLSIALCGVLAARLARSAAAGALGAVLGALAGPWSAYGWSATPFCDAGFLNLGTFRSPTQTFGEPLFLALLFVVCLLLVPTERRRSLFGPAAVLALAAAGAKATFLPILLCGVALAGVAALIWNRRDVLRLAIVGVLAVVVFGLAMALVTGTSSRSLELGDGRQLLSRMQVGRVIGDLTGFRVLLVALVLVAVAWFAAMVGVVFLVRWAYRDLRMWLLLGVALGGGCAAVAGQHPGLSQLYFLRSAWPVFGILSAWGIAVACRRSGLSTRRTLAVAGGGLLAGVGATAVVRLGTGTRPADGSGAGGTLVQPVLVLLAVIAVLGVAAALVPGLVRARSRLGRAGPMRAARPGVVAALVLTTAVAGGTLLVHSPNGRLGLEEDARFDGPAIAPEEAQAGRWIRAHAGPDDLIATNAHCLDRGDPMLGCDARRFTLAALTEVPVHVEGWSYSNPAPKVAPHFTDRGPFWDPDLLKNNDAAFYRPTVATVSALRARGVRYLVVDRRVHPESRELPRFASKVVDRGIIAVYEIGG